ncbi:hypothetical protein AKJ64_03890 [candidate division MSBL1 archaeon SCGC-AAA259E17]|uniref:Uncharacterized protein n=1 Tax=candidate division MSBL1 archaeon SCGC-AAA259E17 TaxID=1698263 RepID=A0A133UDA6_9EURY|nr:hypothetical protein AKJ64_03890 [candidate division MSBL1 archaeon SCGC-AAA259E17]
MKLGEIDSLLSGSREHLIKWMAKHGNVPKRNPWRNLKYGKSDYTLQKMTDELPMSALIEKLGIESDADLETIQEEIKNHPEWHSSL